ncbi:hypothetical protein MTO96_032411 [Rhipicephalus appendiculatus]
MAGLLQPPTAANGNAGGAGAAGGLSAPSSPSLGNRLTVPGSQGPRDRKYSLPLQLQRRPSLSGYAAAVESAREDARRRKFSQVGQVVSHRLSTTIGWKVYTVTTQEVADQAKSLCGRYLRAKLKQCGAVHKKLGLQRLRSVSNMSVGYPTSDVAQRLRLVCSELESSHPDLYQRFVYALPAEEGVGSSAGLRGPPTRRPDTDILFRNCTAAEVDASGDLLAVRPQLFALFAARNTTCGCFYDV